MVDPLNITSFKRTGAELEEFILNAAAFAGKNARQQSIKMHGLFGSDDVSPFERVRGWKNKKGVGRELRGIKIGKYSLLSNLFHTLATSNINLFTCTIEELQQFKGIGPKTARFFVLHSRPEQELIVLDTHILKEMRSLGFTVPKNSPSGKKYLELEQQYIDHLKKSGITDFAGHDLNTWKKYSIR